MRRIKLCPFHGPFFCLVALSIFLSHASAQAQRLPVLDFESAPISYSDGDVDTAVTRLERSIETGEIELEHNEGTGYLAALLEELYVPQSSQMLTFLQSSLQRPLIGPDNARAVFFGDDTYVAHVPGGFIELIVPDSKRGLVFYSLEQVDQRPEFTRQVGRCMTCHSSSRTKNVPGLQIRSMLADPAGHPVLSAGSYRTTQASPFEERWGGWYVTGNHGTMVHRGNFNLPSKKRPKSPIENSAGQNRMQLPKQVASANYLEAHSDIVALMVFEHQIDAHNLMVRTNYAFQIDQQQGVANQETANWRAEAQRLADHLTFKDEFVLTSPVQGSGHYQTEFAARGPFTKSGLSLRQFDLNNRIFKFPCSYTIHSKLFESLPVEAKRFTLQRMLTNLTELDNREHPRSRLYSAEEVSQAIAILKERLTAKPSL